MFSHSHSLFNAKQFFQGAYRKLGRNFLPQRKALIRELHRHFDKSRSARARSSEKRAFATQMHKIAAQVNQRRDFEPVNEFLSANERHSLDSIRRALMRAWTRRSSRARDFESARLFVQAHAGEQSAVDELIVASCRSGDTHEAFQLFAEHGAKSRAALHALLECVGQVQLSDASSDVGGGGLWARLGVDSGQHRELLQRVVAALDARLIAPKARTINCVLKAIFDIDALAAGGDVAPTTSGGESGTPVRELFDAAERVLAPLHSASERVPLNGQTFELLLAHCAALPDLEFVRSLADERHIDTSTPSAHVALVRAYLALGSEEGALRAFRAAKYEIDAPAGAAILRAFDEAQSEITTLHYIVTRLRNTFTQLSEPMLERLLFARLRASHGKVQRYVPAWGTCFAMVHQAPWALESASNKFFDTFAYLSFRPSTPAGESVFLDFALARLRANVETKLSPRTLMAFIQKYYKRYPMLSLRAWKIMMNDHPRLSPALVEKSLGLVTASASPVAARILRNFDALPWSSSDENDVRALKALQAHKVSGTEQQWTLINNKISAREVDTTKELEELVGSFYRAVSAQKKAK